MKILVKFFLTAVDTNNFPFEKLAWPAFEQGSLSRKIVDFFAVRPITHEQIPIVVKDNLSRIRPRLCG